MASSKRVVVLWLLGLMVGGCAGAVPVGPARARPITADATVNTPVCLGFAPDGSRAYVMVANNDPVGPEWYVLVMEVSAGVHQEFLMGARTRDRNVARARFSAMVARVNALIRDHELLACTATEAHAGQPVVVMVQGVKTEVAYQDGNLVVTAEDQLPVVRPQTNVVDLRLLAAYTAPGLPVVAVVFRDHNGTGIDERTELVDLANGPAPGSERKKLRAR